MYVYVDMLHTNTCGVQLLLSSGDEITSDATEAAWRWASTAYSMTEGYNKRHSLTLLGTLLLLSRVWCADITCRNAFHCTHVFHTICSHTICRLFIVCSCVLQKF